MLSVSSEFTEAEQADVNKPAAKVYLILGNYAAPVFGASASASGSDGSGNYPASGAIDGDRTELNVGAASAADNDVGLSSWRSAVAPDTTAQTLTIDMGQSRTINRIKLYHMASHGLSSYKIESSPDNSVYTLVAKTTTQGGTITTTHEVDTIDFTDTTCRYLKLTVSATVVAGDKANVVEFEIYRLVDITDRVISCKTSRARDYQLGNSMASTASIVCSNTDKFFSPSYVPTTDEDDFVNSELKPGIGLLVKFGFDYTGTQEYAQQFIGTVDKLTIKPGARTATIEGRDGMKPLFNRNISTKLKTSQDIGALVTYLLNKANISTWETDVDTANITIDYFFTFDQTIIESIRELVEGAGDANFYFDESGIATFRAYLNSTAMSHTDTTQADFQAGTLTAVDATTEPGKLKMRWYKLDDFEDGDFSADPAWTSVDRYGATGTWAVVSGEARAQSNALGQFLTTPFSAATGTWEFRAKSSDIYSVSPNRYSRPGFFFCANGSPTAPFPGAPFYWDGCITNSYGVTLANDSQILLSKFVGTAQTDLATASYTPSTSYFTIRVTRSSAGVIKVYLDGVLKISVTDTTFNTSALISLYQIGSSLAGTSYGYFDDVYWSPEIEGSESVQTESVFVSDTIDQGATISAEGIFNTTQITPTETSISWYTATSADGSTWDSYVAATPGGLIGSTARRYIRYKAVMTSTSYLVSPTITDVTVSWTLGSGSAKYPVSSSFSFDENLNMDLDQVYADTVGGGTSIINSSSVRAQPLVLDGADTDVQWQGTTGTPPVDISASNPLGVTNLQVLTYRIVVSGGMDTSRMSGANPAAAAITFAGGGSGTWVFSSIHPTRPVLVITITGTGTITNLQVQGKAFTSDGTYLEAVASDTDSIQEFGERKNEISSKYILSSAMAQTIATRIVENFSQPTTYTPQIKVRPTYSIQVGDRIQLIDDHLGIQEDDIVIGVEHIISASTTGGDAYTMLKLLKI